MPQNANFEAASDISLSSLPETATIISFFNINIQMNKLFARGNRQLRRLEAACRDKEERCPGGALLRSSSSAHTSTTFTSSVHSTRSTSSDFEGGGATTTRRLSKSPLQVRFADPIQVFYEPPPKNLDRIDSSMLWFQRDEIASSLRQREDQIEAVRMKDSILMVTTSAASRSNFWTVWLASAYEKACKQAASARKNGHRLFLSSTFASLQQQQQQQHRPSPAVVIPADMVGLDKSIVDGGRMVCDRMQRRREIMQSIAALQRQHADRPAMQEKLIRRASCAISQPARVYAHTIALLSAQSSG